MKKRILLSLVSFFMMTAMWASQVDAYQIYVTAAQNGKTNGTAQLTLNMKNRASITTWTCVVALPEGVTYVDGSVAIVDARYPEGYNAVITATDNGNGTVTFSCEGAVGVAMTGTDGAIATFEVAIGNIEAKDYNVTVVKEQTKLVDDTNGIHTDEKDRVFVWTIEQGEPAFEQGDVNGDGTIDIADAVTVLNVMAGSTTSVGDADVNKDGQVDIADFVTVLNIMAGQI